MSSRSPFGTRKEPTRLRLIAIGVLIFAAVVIVLSLFGGGDDDDDDDEIDSMGTNVVGVAQLLNLPVAGCYSDGGYAVSRNLPGWEETKIDCLDRFATGPFSRENSEKFQKYGGTVVIGCAGGFAAGSGPGAIYGCTAAALAAAWDWSFSD